MVKILKRYIVLIVMGAAVLAIIWLTRKQWLPSLGNIFAAQPVTIDNTPVLIKEINELAQLCTVTAYDEVVVDSVDTRLNAYRDAMKGYGLAYQTMVPQKRLVLIAKGKVVAGVDLKQIRPESIYINKDSIALQLPVAGILDVIVNPSDFEIFSEEGIWTDEAVTAVRIKARNVIIQRALQQGVLKKAADRSQLLMQNFLHTAGFQKITVVNGPMN